MKLRLLFYVPNAWWGGMQCWATYLLKHLPRDEFDVRIVAWKGIPEALADLGGYGDLVHLDCPVEHVGPRVAGEIERWRPHVVHANNVRVAEAAVEAGVPCLTTLHSIHGDKQTRTGCEVADRVYKASPAVAGRYPVILNGVDPVPWGERQEHLVVFIGRLDNDRRPERLLRAMRTVRYEVPDVRLRIIGKACTREFDLQGHIQRRKLDGITETVGLVPPAEARRLLAEGDVVCAPAPDGFGLGTAEAMSAGLIPVVSPNGYGPEMVSDLGVIAGPDDLPDALVRALTDDDLSSRRGEIAERTWALYSAHRFSAKYARVYREMAQ